MSLIFNLILVPVPILSEPLVLLDPLVEDARAWDNAWTETIFGNGTPPFKTIVYSSPQVIWNSTHWVKYEIKSINETTIILRTPSCAYLVGELVVSLLASNEAIDVGGMEWIVEQYSEKLNQWLPKTVETASVSYNSTHVWQKWTFSDGSERVLYIGHDNKQTFSFTSKISATYRVAWHFIDVNATRTIYSSGNETRLNKGSEFSLTDFNFTRLILYNENGYSLLVDYNDIDQSYYRNLVFGSSETGLAYTNLICGNWTTNPDETITIDPFTKTFLSEDNLDGILFKWGFSYPPTDIYGPYQEFGTGQNRIGDMFLIYRGYASFDTSDIRDYSVITDATLKLKTLGLDTVLYDFDVRVMGGSQPLYGSSLETADWDCGTTEVATWSTSDYPGDDIYINITIPTDQVNVEGRTQFELKSDREGTPPTHAEIIAFYDGCVAGSEPKLEITWLPNSISVDGQTWYYWNSTTNEKAAIVLFGGYYYDVPDINWINVGSLFYRDLFIQDPWPYHKEKFVVDLHSNGFDVLSPKDDTYQEELSYYDATSDWVKDASMWLTEKGYDSIFLFGFSAGGVVAAYEIQKDYASIFSAAVVANAPVDNDEYGDIFNSADTASQVKVCTSFIASENDIPIIEQMENYYDNTTVHKEWHLWEGGHDPFPNNCLDHPTETVFDVTYKWWKDHIPLTSYLDEGAPRPGWVGSIHVSVDDAGDILAAYGGGAAYDDLSFRKSTNGGLTWSSRVLIDSDIVFGLYGNTLIFYESTSDRIGVVYHDRSDNLAAKYSTDGGSTWSARNVGRYGTIPVFTGILVGSKVLVELCDYGANYYLYQMKYDIGTNTWSTATQITNFGKIYYPRALFKDVEGRLHLAFSRYTTKYRDVYYMYSDDEGSTWRDVNGNILSLPISIDSTARVYTGADIQAMDVSADGTGKIYILCKEGRIYFYNGASWTMKTTSITVDTKSGPAKSLIFHKGKLHAIFQVWDGVNNPTKDYVYAYSCDDGDSWSHPPKITWDTIYDEAEIMNNIVYNDKWYGIFIHGFTKSYGQDIHFLSVTC